ncbi:unnamed protein product [Didymodactylos carnosus]|uniref:V-SNARE coiled-coil homology domain-containing protein n=1 Tax=Didymodactylos carnosus TaxID=1234261 RepID=A0A813TQS0_9BILA|nr:unnamed protein product [Didymodactylos carnosus]CAF0817187.1 unnamed protein product [Didymodactylos carnosus]CAF3517260.1 unnamed protein product [Didymodactylos carnosus]CAF3603414.1 unnamed protein product [Didymodactylos carnosus]
MKFRIPIKKRTIRKRMSKIKTSLPPLSANNVSKVGIIHQPYSHHPYSETIPKTTIEPVDERKIQQTSLKIDAVLNMINEAYEKTLIRQYRLDELDKNADKLILSAGQFQKTAAEVQRTIWCQNRYCCYLVIASSTAIAAGGLIAMYFISRPAP